mmetsp:Transcript_17296/g.53174  ORF Transcript_17296/g.53174 Transcript_17296/m.53174 type:complete len:491 (-) Transcript_17296:74-1546(-)
MRYRSTRGGVKDCSFVDAVLMGLAPDKGLLVPHTIPKVDGPTLDKWAELSFPELATEIISLYIDPAEITKAELAQMTKTAYSSFRTDHVTPIHQLEGDLWLLELFHGPTYAFKDVALQFLGTLFELILTTKKPKGQERLTIVGATSGDTGSSAIAGVRGKEGVECFILYPENRTSPIQEAQMCAYDDSNIHAIALRGAFFDDCQKIVKGLFADTQFHAKHALGAVNSINWARIVAQIVYYFYAAFQLRKQAPGSKPPCFSVPTGNFGDVLAGWYAKEMGCPCRGLVVATNSNDILARFFASGRYEKPASAVETLAPSMDICVSSNFERFVFHCAGNDTDEMNTLMDAFESTGKFAASPALHAKARSEMHAAAVQKPELLATIQKWQTKTGYVLDPHTAIGVRAVEDLGADLGEGPVVCLACAHYGKFPAAVEAALGDKAADIPEETNLTKLLKVPHRKTILANSAAAVIEFIEETMAGLPKKPAAKKAKA